MLYNMCVKCVLKHVRQLESSCNFSTRTSRDKRNCVIYAVLSYYKNHGRKIEITSSVGFNRVLTELR